MGIECLFLPGTVLGTGKIAMDNKGKQLRFPVTFDSGVGNWCRCQIGFQQQWQNKKKREKKENTYLLCSLIWGIKYSQPARINPQPDITEHAELESSVYHTAGPL